MHTRRHANSEIDDPVQRGRGEGAKCGPRALPALGAALALAALLVVGAVGSGASAQGAQAQGAQAQGAQAQGAPAQGAPAQGAPEAAGGAGAAAVPAPGDPGRGAALFSGRARLQHGGPPCGACHSVAGENALGGGSMGRDLTAAYDRLGQNAGMKAVLGNIAFPAMRQAFAGKPLTQAEIDDLTAYLQVSDERARAAGTAPADPGRFGFNWLWLFAILGAALLNALLLIWWPRQREGLADRLRRTGRSWRKPLGGGRR